MTPSPFYSAIQKLPGKDMEGCAGTSFFIKGDLKVERASLRTSFNTKIHYMQKYSLQYPIHHAKTIADKYRAITGITIDLKDYTPGISLDAICLRMQMVINQEHDAEKQFFKNHPCLNP